MFWKTAILAFFVVGVFAKEHPIMKLMMKPIVLAECTKNNAEDKADDVVASIFTYVDCTSSIKWFELKWIIEAVWGNGANGEVFKEYCAKTRRLKFCLHNLLDGVSPCLDEAVQSDIDYAKNIIDHSTDFLCDNDGDRLALFINEGGLQCIKRKWHPIRNCIANVNFSERDNYLTAAERCVKFDKAGSCIIQGLKQCDSRTPGNMAESLFRYVREATRCHTALPLRN